MTTESDWQMSRRWDTAAVEFCWVIASRQQNCHTQTDTYSNISYELHGWAVTWVCSSWVGCQTQTCTDPRSSHYQHQLLDYHNQIYRQTDTKRHVMKDERHELLVEHGVWLVTCGPSADTWLQSANTGCSLEGNESLLRRHPPLPHAKSMVGKWPGSPVISRRWRECL